MCDNAASILVCGEVVIPVSKLLGVRPAKCGEFELCTFYPRHPDGDRYLCEKCAAERGLKVVE